MRNIYPGCQIVRYPFRYTGTNHPGAVTGYHQTHGTRHVVKKSGPVCSPTHSARRTCYEMSKQRFLIPAKGRQFSVNGWKPGNGTDYIACCRTSTDPHRRPSNMIMPTRKKEGRYPFGVTNITNETALFPSPIIKPGLISSV
jgi:hypothetical protein